MPMAERAVAPTLAGDNLERHRAFRNRGSTDRPLLGINVGFSLQELFPGTMSAIDDGPLRPDGLPVAEFLADCDAIEIAHRGLGDYPVTIAPLVALPWMEAIAGCPIVASRHSIWAEPCVEDWRCRTWPASFLDDSWSRTLLDLIDILEKHAEGRFLVTHTLMRGPSDILCAMRGAQRLVLDLVDEPETVAVNLDEAARLWEELGTAQLARLPEPAAGCVAGAAALRCWAPHKTLWLQEDAMTILSPGLFTEWILPVDRRLSESFPGLVFHLHGSALWAIDSLVASRDVGVIELNLEDANCDLEGTFAGWRRIQRHKPVIAWRKFGPDFVAWLDRVLSELAWEGLSIQVSTRDREEAETVQRVFDQAILHGSNPRKAS